MSKAFLIFLLRRLAASLSFYLIQKLIQFALPFCAANALGEIFDGVHDAVGTLHLEHGPLDADFAGRATDHDGLGLVVLQVFTKLILLASA